MSDKMLEAFERDHGPLCADKDMQKYFARHEGAMKWAWQAARTVPSLHAEQIRVAAVAAIREVTGCPDIKGNDGTYLVDALIVNLLSAAQEPKK